MLTRRGANVKNIEQTSGDVPRATMATLMLAVFTVSVGFGVVLPLLPDLIEPLLGGEVTAAQVSRHTGLERTGSRRP